MNKISLLLLFTALLNPNGVRAESCTKLKDNIVEYDKQQMSLKHPTNKKSLANLQEEHDEALAEMLFFHGLIKTRQQYEALLSNYANQREAQIAKSVEDFRKELLVLGNTLVVDGLLSDFKGLYTEKNFADGKAFYDEIKNICANKPSDPRSKSELCVLILDTNDPFSEGERVVSAFFDYQIEILPESQKTTDKKVLIMQRTLGIYQSFMDGLPKSAETLNSYNKLKLLLSKLEAANLATIPEELLNSPLEEGVKLSDKIKADPKLVELRELYVDFVQSVDENNTLAYKNKDGSIDTRTGLIERNKDQSAIVESLAKLHQLGKEKEKYDFVTELAGGFDKQLADVNRRLAYSRARQAQKDTEGSISKEKKSFKEMYNKMVDKIEGCEKIEDFEKSKDSINKCLKEKFTVNDLGKKFMAAKAKVAEKANEILAIKGNEVTRRQWWEFLASDNEFQKLDRLKHINLAQYKNQCVSGNKSITPQFCQNTIAKNQDLSVSLNSFETLVSDSGEILATLRTDLIKQYPLNTPEERREVAAILEDRCEGNPRLPGCLEYEKRRTRREFHEHHHIDPNNRWLDKKKTIPNYVKNKPWWQHGILYAAKSFTNPNDPNSPANIWGQSMSANLQYDQMKYNAMGFKQGEHTANQYRDWYAEQAGYIPDGMGGYFPSAALYASSPAIDINASQSLDFSYTGDGATPSSGSVAFDFQQPFASSI